MKDYFANTFDWFVESPYLTEEWIEGEEPVFDLVQEAGVVPEDARVPRHAVMTRTPKVGPVRPRRPRRRPRWGVGRR